MISDNFKPLPQIPREPSERDGSVSPSPGLAPCEFQVHLLCLPESPPGAFGLRGLREEGVLRGFEVPLCSGSHEISIQGTVDLLRAPLPLRVFPEMEAEVRFMPGCSSKGAIFMNP